MASTSLLRMAELSRPMGTLYHTIGDEARIPLEGLAVATDEPPHLKGPNGLDLVPEVRRTPGRTDLLLHDIGTGDGIAQGAAGPGEIRTPALWGLRFRRPLLHDGSAATVADAVRRHGGEAALARRSVERLREDEWLALLAFLHSL